MNATQHGAQVASTVKAERQVGPETRAVRIFRETLAKSAFKFGHLKPDLDLFLKTVLEDKDAKRSDKTYARKIHADLLRMHTGSAVALPQVDEEMRLSEQDINEILTAAEEVETHAAQPPVSPPPTMVVDPLGDDLDNLFVPDEPPPDPIEVICEQLIGEFKTSEYPFVRMINHNGALFIALGTVLGTVTSGKYQGKSVNIHCTVAGFKRLRDAEKEHAYFVRGRPLKVTKEEPSGLRKHIFCLKHKPGMKIRYWFRIDGEDVVDRARFLVCTESEFGWKHLTRDQF